MPQSTGLENLNDMQVSILSTWPPDPETKNKAELEILKRMSKRTWSNPRITEQDLIRFNLVEPDESISKIKKRKYHGSSEKYENCPICLEDFKKIKLFIP